MAETFEGEAVEVGSTLAVARPLSVPVPQFFSIQSPAEKVAFATEVANALKPIIVQKKLSHKLNKKNPDDEYVELEAWQTCGFLCGMTAKVISTEPLPNGQGFLAKAVVVRVDTGVEIGAGEQECSRNEENWKSRADYALRGMAETRAQSRALRGVLAWILVLAGYKPTPSEEMPPGGVGFDAPPCPECGKEDTTRVSTFEGKPPFYCWKKIGGCGATFAAPTEPAGGSATSTSPEPSKAQPEPSAASKNEPPADAGSLFDQADAAEPKKRRTAAEWLKIIDTDTRLIANDKLRLYMDNAGVPASANIKGAEQAKKVIAAYRAFTKDLDEAQAAVDDLLSHEVPL